MDGLKSIFRYDDLVKKIIAQIKYRLVKEAIDEFVASIPPQKKEELFFYKQLAKDYKFLPVPLHRKKLRQRGFNQSFEMVKFFADMLNFPVVEEMVSRVKNTKPQVEFSTPKDRQNNIVGAFSLTDHIISNQIEGKKFIVFDDVWTTGWTIKEITKVLKKHGASKVFALTIAR